MCSETHLTDDILDIEIKIKGYTILRTNSKSKRTGGVCVFVKKNFKIRNSKSNSTDFIWLHSFELYTSNNDIVKIISVYMSASANKKEILDYFDEWCEENCEHGSIIMSGDFNIDMRGDISYKDRLLNICGDIGLKQLVNGITRRTSTTATTIDLCFSNLHLDVSISDDDQISDHRNVEIILNVPQTKKNNKFRTVKIWNGYSQYALLELLKTRRHEWESMRNKNCEVKTKWLIDMLNGSADRFIVEKRIRSEDDFFDNELEKMRKIKNELYKTAQYSGDDNAWNTFRMYKNQYKRTIDIKRYRHMQNKLNKVKNDPKKTWKMLNSLLKDNNNDLDYIINNDMVYESVEEIASEFNKYFVNTPIKIYESIPAEPYEDDIQMEINHQFTFNTINTVELKKYLIQCDKKQSRDKYNISVQFLLDGFEVIGDILTNIVNTSFDSCHFPQILRESIIVPIQKINGSVKMDEFRPINTLPCVEKCLEKIAYDQFSVFIKHNNILCDEQSGFRSSHSCESALNYVIDEWKTSLEKGESILAVFLDFQKAFETIDRNMLLNKLSKYGVGPGAIAWFTSYLSDRTQRVKFNDVISDAVINKFGVPQGSVLGPLLFIIYINDLKNCLRYCKIKFFADDTLIYIKFKDVEDGENKMNIDLNNLFKKINQNKLKLNVNKTKLMLITKKTNIGRDLINIKIDNNRLEFVNELKYLGVIIDNNLSFKNNCNYVIRKMALKTGILSRVGNRLSMQQKIEIYKATIETHLNYCSTILFLSSDTDIHRIQKVQSKCMRSILKVGYNYSTANLLVTLEFLSVKQRIILNTLVNLYKIINKTVPSYLSQRIHYKSDNIRKATLRNKNAIETNNARKVYSQNSIFYKGIIMYNQIPIEIRNTQSFNKFKSNVYKFVKSNY